MSSQLLTWLISVLMRQWKKKKTMCCFCGDNLKTHFVLALILSIILFSLGLALSILGEASHRLEMCQVEPSLNLWMMTAGKYKSNMRDIINFNIVMSSKILTPIQFFASFRCLIIANEYGCLHCTHIQDIHQPDTTRYWNSRK